MTRDARGGYRGDSPSAQVPPPPPIPSEAIRPKTFLKAKFLGGAGRVHVTQTDVGARRRRSASPSP